MKLKNVAILVIIVVFLTIGIMKLTGGASIGSFQLDIDDVELYQTCNNCTYCNFTRVMSPNNQTLLSNLNASNESTYFYYLVAKGNFTKVGTHNYCYDCGNTIEKSTGCLTFEITYIGGELTLQMAMLYFISIGVLIFFFVLVVILISKLPSKDATDEEGTILQISNLKHLRPVLWVVCWGIILAMVFIVSNMALAYLPNKMIGSFFWLIYRIMFLMTLVGVPLWFIWIFAGIFKDKEYKRMIERGIDVKTP